MLASEILIEAELIDVRPQTAVPQFQTSRDKILAAIGNSKWWVSSRYQFMVIEPAGRIS